MRKIVLLALVLLASCTSTTSTVHPGEPPTETTWISPAKVEIGNFYPGNRAEWPITVYNSNYGDACFSVRCDAPRPERLKAGYSMPPDEARDWVIIVDPTPVAYVTVTADRVSAVATASCLIPETAHDIVATVSSDGVEISWTQGEVASRVLVRGSSSGQPENMDSGYLVYHGDGTRCIDRGATVTRYYSVWSEAVGEGVICIGPRQTKDVLVALDMPYGTTAPRKWEFLMVVREHGQAQIQIELASRWLVEMGRSAYIVPAQEPNEGVIGA